MQRNKHVLIHTSNLKNTSVVLVSFIMWMTKCTRVDTVSELMSPHRRGGDARGGERNGEKKAVHFPNLWPLPPADWPEYVANRGMLQLGLLAVHPCFRGPETFEMMEQLLTRRHFKGFQKFCRYIVKWRLKMSTQTPKFKSLTSRECRSWIRPELGFLGQGGACRLPQCRRQKTT